MRHILTVFFLIFAINGKAQAVGSAAKHLGAGAVIGGIGGYTAHKIFKGQRGWIWVGAVGGGLAAGLAKETFYDQPRGASWETKDVLYTTLGGVLSGLALDLFFKNSRRPGGGGRKCGCLVVQTNDLEPSMLYYSKNGSGNISSEIEVSYLLK